MASLVAEMYGLNISPATGSAVTDKLLPEIKEWKERSLASHYLFWLNAILYKKKAEGRYVSKAVIRFWV